MRSVRLSVFLIINSILLGPTAFGQSQNLNFERLSFRQGLSNNTVYCTFQDKKGFIWVGTNDGLNCFDGLNFKVYNHNSNDPNSISDDQINTIAEDENGNLWIGLWIGGLNMYDRSTDRFIHFLHDDEDSSSISSNNIWTVCIDRSNNIWAGTLGEGLNLFDPESRTFKRFIHQPSDAASISDNAISAIFEDHNGDLWIGTRNGGLNLLNRQTNDFRVYRHDPGNSNSLGSDKINTLFEDDRHNLWIGTEDKGITVLSADRKQFTNYTASSGSGKLNCNNIRSFIQNGDGTIWIATDGGGINFFNPDSASFSHMTYDPKHLSGISSNVIFDLFKSKDDIIWIGTFQGGLNYYDSKKYKFKSFREVNTTGKGLSYKSVMSVFEDSGGVLWFGTDGGGLNRYDSATNSFTYYFHDPRDETSISGNVIKSIFEDSEGDLWFGTHANGLNLLIRDNEEFLHYKHNSSNPNSISQDDIWDIVEDSDGNLWIGTLSGGLNLFERETGTFSSYRADEKPGSLCSNNIFCITADKKSGGLWIGTKFGLSYLNIETRKFKNYVHINDDPNSLSNNDVNYLYQDSQNNLWVGTNKGGLNLYIPETDHFISYGTQDGLISNTVSGIVEDNEHNLWISTNRGISRFNPQENAFANYTVADGLQSNEFLCGSVYKRRNGDLIFGGTEGFNIIEPEKIKDNKYIPEVLLTRLLVDDQVIAPGDKSMLLDQVISETHEITFDYTHSVITFEFTALNYTNSEKNQFAYKLDGFDENWNYIGTRRNVTFTNLDPRTYTLMVKASNNDGIWNETGTSIAIHILPPYWKTFWFRMAVILILIFIIISWYTYRIRTMKMQRLKLESLVQQRTIELANEKEKVERKNAKLLEKQNEILNQNIEIKEMSEKIHRADEEKIKFFTNISHEIRTPLTLILSPLEKLQTKYSEDSFIQGQLSRIYRNALSLKRLVNQILDFRKIDNDSYPLQACKCDIVTLLKEITAAFYDVAIQNHIHFTFNSDPDKIEAWIDYEKLDKIIHNLLSNAFKYTQAGGEISVTVTHKREIPGETDSNKKHFIVIQVRDNGVGIPEAQLEKVFDRFYQANHQKMNFQGGTGIGLSIAQSLVQIHHGKITVESKEGKGSCFSVCLPAGNEHLKESEILRPEIKEKSDLREESMFHTKADADDVDERNYGGKKPRMLVVEDNSELRFYIKDSLRKDYEIIEATNGKEGLKLTRKFSPNIILSDIMMPEMDGLEFCRIVKTSIETSHIPVILLTAKAAREHKHEGLGMGADDYIIKPFDFKELQIKLNNIYRTRELLRSKFSKEIILKPGDITLTPADEIFIKKAIEIVENHISDNGFKISDFVAGMGVSRSVFYIKIKELTGSSVNEFIKTIRLKRAAQLIRQNQLTVSEIAYMVGFNDPNHFGKCFKKHFGESPGSYHVKK